MPVSPASHNATEPMAPPWVNVLASNLDVPHSNVALWRNDLLLARQALVCSCCPHTQVFSQSLVLDLAPCGSVLADTTSLADKARAVTPVRHMHMTVA